ncbi:MAG: multicopper oxidase domain-containing protein, partial [Chitinophagales bacterium]
EIWEVSGETMSHPFHVHDVDFFILDENGNSIPPNEQGKKDVVLVMPMQTVRIIMKFSDYADETIPYMYHCHLLLHEDDGMMGSFLVLDSSSVGIDEVKAIEVKLFPNPASQYVEVNVQTEAGNKITLKVRDVLGNELNVPMTFVQHSFWLDLSALSSGMYFLSIAGNNFSKTEKLLIEK